VGTTKETIRLADEQCRSIKPVVAKFMSVAETREEWYKVLSRWLEGLLSILHTFCGSPKRHSDGRHVLCSSSPQKRLPDDTCLLGLLLDPPYRNLLSGSDIILKILEEHVMRSLLLKTISRNGYDFAGPELPHPYIQAGYKRPTAVVPSWPCLHTNFCIFYQNHENWHAWAFVRFLKLSTLASMFSLLLLSLKASRPGLWRTRTSSKRGLRSLHEQSASKLR